MPSAAFALRTPIGPDVRRRRRSADVGFAIVMATALAGCAGQMMTAVPAEAQFAAIQPGMSREEVLSRVGRPTWTFGVRQEELTIWNYRFNPTDCIIFQVSMRPNGTVRDASSAWDPACDEPARRRR